MGTFTPRGASTAEAVGDHQPTVTLHNMKIKRSMQQSSRCAIQSCQLAAEQSCQPACSCLQLHRCLGITAVHAPLQKHASFAEVARIVAKDIQRICDLQSSSRQTISVHPKPPNSSSLSRAYQKFAQAELVPCASTT